MLSIYQATNRNNRENRGLVPDCSDRAESPTELLDRFYQPVGRLQQAGTEDFLELDVMYKNNNNKYNRK
jgi:hypothetical protein